MGVMNKPLFDLDQVGMNAELNSYKPGNGLAWSVLFPLKFTPKFDLKGIEGDEGIPVAAERVAFNVKAPLKTRKTVGSWSGSLDKISVSREKDELAINEYNDLKVIAAANDQDKSTAQYLVDMVYDDLAFVNSAMDYKVEIDALRIGSQGIKTYPAEIDGENATADVINFNVPTTNFAGVATPWATSASADGIADIIKQQKAIAKKGLKKPMVAIMEQAAFEALILQTKTLNRLASITAGGVVQATDVTLDKVNSYMVSKGYPKIYVLESYATIQDKNGKETTIKPWHEHVVTLAPTLQLGWTYYKPVPMVPNTEALQAYGKYYKTTVYSELNPMHEVTMAEGYIQPALINRRSLVFININKTTWSNGAAE